MSSEEVIQRIKQAQENEDTELNLSACSFLKAVPAELGKLSSLQSLNLFGCEQLSDGVSGARLQEFSSHSLRAGFCTQASLNGASVIEIKQRSRHRSTSTLERYIRAGRQMRIRVSGKLGL